MSRDPTTSAVESALDGRDGGPESDAVTARTWKIGPTIALCNLGIAALATVIVFAVGGGVHDEETYFTALATVAKVSLPMFILVFICRPLHDAVGSSVTAWLLARRRYLGLSFASWHLMHWPILGGLMVLLGPATFWEGFREIAVPAGSVLLVITLMAATSTDGAVRFFGNRIWSTIHTLGLYTVWVWFFHVYADGLDFRGLHGYVYFGLLIAALAFRWIMAGHRLWKRFRHVD